MLNQSNHGEQKNVHWNISFFILQCIPITLHLHFRQKHTSFEAKPNGCSCKGSCNYPDLSWTIVPVFAALVLRQTVRMFSHACGNECGDDNAFIWLMNEFVPFPSMVDHSDPCQTSSKKRLAFEDTWEVEKEEGKAKGREKDNERETEKKRLWSWLPRLIRWPEVNQGAELHAGTPPSGTHKCTSVWEAEVGLVMVVSFCLTALYLNNNLPSFSLHYFACSSSSNM